MPVSANQGSTGGGTLMTITGTNLSGTSAVEFPSKSATQRHQRQPDPGHHGVTVRIRHSGDHRDHARRDQQPRAVLLRGCPVQGFTRCHLRAAGGWQQHHPQRSRPVHRHQRLVRRCDSHSDGALRRPAERHRARGPGRRSGRREGDHGRRDEQRTVQHLRRRSRHHYRRPVLGADVRRNERDHHRYEPRQHRLGHLRR